MQKIAFILLSALALGCAGQAKTTKLVESLENDHQIKSPFLDKIQEEIFWSIIRGEVVPAPNSHNLDNDTALLIRKILINKTEIVARIDALHQLKDLTIAPEKLGSYCRNFEVGHAEDRLWTLKAFFNDRYRGQEILTYALNSPRMLTFIADEMTKSAPSPNDGKLEHNH